MATAGSSSVPRSLVKLVAVTGLTALAAAVGTRATIRGKGLWYRFLRKPPFQPPDWLFGPVWTTLYGTIVLSGWRVSTRPPSVARNVALGLWATQLGLNASWSVLFFGLHKKRLALADLGLLIGSVGGYMAAAYRVDRPAALLMAPYLGWCGFAGLLNAEIVRRN